VTRVSGRILITGGAGFIGSHVVELLRRVATVSVLDDFSRGRREWLGEEVEVFHADVRDEGAVMNAFSAFRPECVVHLAAVHYIPTVDGAPEVAEAINVCGTENVAAAVRAWGVEHVVFASTAAVYPDLVEPMSEELPVAPIDLYGRTKVRGEAILTHQAAVSGVSASLVRLFNVIGRRETNPHLLPEIVSQLRVGAKELYLGNIHTSRDFVDARDVALAFGLLIRQRPKGVSVFNVGNGRSVSVEDLVAAFAEILNRDIVIHTDPQRKRPVDRKVLIADNRRLLERGWLPKHSLHATLTELLETEAAVGST
jgi:UDP-glucose 4-epimerase